VYNYAFAIFLATTILLVLLSGGWWMNLGLILVLVPFYFL
jgi:hypothetical protein